MPGDCSAFNTILFVLTCPALSLSLIDEWTLVNLHACKFVPKWQHSLCPLWHKVESALKIDFSWAEDEGRREEGLLKDVEEGPQLVCRRRVAAAHVCAFIGFQLNLLVASVFAQNCHGSLFLTLYVFVETLLFIYFVVVFALDSAALRMYLVWALSFTFSCHLHASCLWKLKWDDELPSSYKLNHPLSKHTLEFSIPFENCLPTQTKVEWSLFSFIQFWQKMPPF